MLLDLDNRTASRGHSCRDKIEVRRLSSQVEEVNSIDKILSITSILSRHFSIGIHF